MQGVQRIQEAVSQGRIAAVYLWHGEERFQMQECLARLKKNYLTDDPSGSGIESCSADEVSPRQIVERANEMSFFQQRLLIIDDVTYFQDGQSAELDPLYEYLANPNQATCLVLLAEKINRGRKLYKLIEQNGEIWEFNAPKRYQEWQDWLKAELKARGKSMNSEAGRLFLERAGHQTGILSQELDKLAVFVGEREIIRVDDVQLLTPRTVETTVFQLLDAVAQRKTGEALRNLHDVLLEEHPLKVLTMLERQLRLLLGAQSWRDQGGNGAELSSVLKISPFEAQKVWQQAQRLSWDALVKAMKECLRTGIALKSSGGDPGFLLEIMVVKFCR